ncbi:hypothetical protein H8J93_14810 [Clostridium perfringens]|nr:hypothetical protein [Clostridium perfringens]MBI6060963.1 hypothetical protein [Clostridium perfringens]
MCCPRILAFQCRVVQNDNIDEACDLAFNIIVEIANTNEEEKIILKET